MRLTRNTTDLAGRPCSTLEFGVSYLDVYQAQDQLFFDPRTAEPRGGRYLITRNLMPFGARAGSDEGFTTRVTAGFVKAIGDTSVQQ